VHNITDTGEQSKKYSARRVARDSGAQAARQRRVQRCCIITDITNYHRMTSDRRRAPRAPK
jgi:hypothetical protein